MSASIPVILGSASSRRQELLGHLLKDFKVIPAHIDESVLTNEAPSDYVQRLADEKSAAIATLNPNAWVLGADTVVVHNQRILQKPVDQADSQRTLMLLSESWHQVYTALCVQGVFDGLTVKHALCVNTEVEFAKVTPQQCKDYWQTQEPQDKAGSYAIQGIGGQFVKQIKGSYSSVVGLPLVETRKLLVDIEVLS
jgi:septum formation protein